MTGDTAIALRFADDSVAPSEKCNSHEPTRRCNKEPVCDADAGGEVARGVLAGLGTDKVTALISQVTASVVKVLVGVRKPR